MIQNKCSKCQLSIIFNEDKDWNLIQCISRCRGEVNDYYIVCERCNSRLYIGTADYSYGCGINWFQEWQLEV
jgi:hypothetical protein